MRRLCSVAGQAQVNQVNQLLLLVLNSGARWARHNRGHKQNMKKTIIILAAGALLTVGCQTNTGKGAGIGAAAGAILGGVIGHQSGKGLEGAAIGAAAGGAVGAAVGASKDAEERKNPTP
jgi:predicted small secreted protein